MPDTSTPAPEDLRIFLRVAALQSFTGAAAQLGLPRATVSTAVQRLEGQLGARLLQRTTRRVQLTADGQTFADRARDVLADLDELHTLLRTEPTHLTGRLRVDMPLGMARERIVPHLTSFLQQHPGIELELGSTDRRIDPVSEGYDCVLRVGPLHESSLIARPLGHLPLVNVASPAYLAQRGPLVTLADLAQHHLVHYQPNLGERSAGFEHVDPDTGATVFVPMAGPLTVNNSEAYLAAALAGLGLAQIPAHTAQPHVQRGALQTVLPDHRPAPMPVTLLYPHRRHLPKRVVVFMEWVSQLLSASPHVNAQPAAHVA